MIDLNLKPKLNNLLGYFKSIPSKYQRIILYSLIATLVVAILLVLILSKVSKSTFLKQRAAGEEAAPDLRCSLEVEVADVPTSIPTDIPIVNPTNPPATNTPRPTATQTPRPSSTLTPRPTSTTIPAAATPTLCPINPSGVCPSTFSPPPGNNYPDLDLTSACEQGAVGNCSQPGGTLTVKKGSKLTVLFNLHNVYTRKVCVSKCDTNFGNRQGWENCIKTQSGNSITYPVVQSLGYYQLLPAGYSADNNYACSSQLYYTYSSTDENIPYCKLGQGCSCQNTPINLIVIE